MRKTTILLAIGFATSVLFHLVLLNVAIELYLKLDVFSSTSEARLFDVQQLTVESEPIITLGRSQWTVEDLIELNRAATQEETPLQTVEDMKKLLAEKGLYESMTGGEEDLADLVELITQQPEKLVEELTIPAESTPVTQEILAIEEGLFEEEIDFYRRPVKSSGRGYAKSDFIRIAGDAEPTGMIANAKNFPTTEEEELVLIMRESAPPDQGPEQAAGDGPTTPTPEPKEIEEVEIPEILRDTTIEENIETIRKYPSLDDLLHAKLFTYSLPDEEKGFFMVVIEPKRDREKFEVIPKDIVFVIDSSKSIIQPKLDRYISGIQNCLKNLNEFDRFNIIEFKDYINRLSPEMLPASQTNIQLGSKFLSAMVSASETDIYRSLSNLVLSRPSKHRPYIIMLVTDGRPTAGIVDNRAIINQISAINNDMCAIYSFAGGRRINKYLLDLLSYRNKGQSRFQPKFTQIEESLEDFYKEMRYPLLINLRYNLAGIDKLEIYPKVLPDFYYNSKLVIAGRYDKQAEFSLQILGQVGGKTKEFILKKRFTKSDGSDPNVARVWAFNKIYHMVGRMAVEGRTSHIIDQIRTISKKYNVRSPY
jgi:uncharacterized protein YegL